MTEYITKKAAQPSVSKTEIVGDVIGRQAAIEIVRKAKDKSEAHRMLVQLPSAQSDRDIPKKPNETTDKAWGIPRKQAVCPNCDSYLGMVHFISENGNTKVTYCESCGQAIDWEGWEDDESNKQAN